MIMKPVIFGQIQVILIMTETNGGATMILRRLIKAVGGAEKAAQYGYILASFDLDKGLWKKEFVKMHETKLRVNDQSDYEVVEFGNCILIDDDQAHHHLDEWDTERKGRYNGGFDARDLIIKTIKDLKGSGGDEIVDELALKHKKAKLGVL